MGKDVPTNGIVFTSIGVLHLAVGVGLLIGLPIENVSSIASVTQLLGRWGAALLLTTIGVLALFSMLASKRYVAMGLLISQQIVLIASGVAGILCAFGGAYSDGTIQNGWHIFFVKIYSQVLLRHPWPGRFH